MHNFWDLKDGSEEQVQFLINLCCHERLGTALADVNCQFVVTRSGRTSMCTADRGHGAVLQERRTAGVTAHLRFSKEWPEVQGGLSL
jgi:hypothetical protein